MTAASAPVSLGVAGALGPGLIAEIAVAAEAAGFHALWVNDTPTGDALTALAAAADATTTLGLATGVLPLDRRPAAEIAAAAAALPAGRTTLGVGSGQTRVGALRLVGDGVRVLRAETGCRVLVGALGPRMRRLGAAHADGVLLSWLPPADAAAQAQEAHEVADGAHAALYVRTALDDAGSERLRREAERYAALPQYGANLARIGADVTDTVLTGPGVESGLDAYRDAVDEVVLRAIVAEDTADAYRTFVEAAGAMLRAA
ncbi:LLM class flavin-dependent oxidoreductase [Microbacterium sp. GXF7504]